MRVMRSKSLTTKLTPAEYAALEALAGAVPPSAWAREQLLAVIVRRPIEETLVSELLALRTIVVNLEFAHLHGDVLTADAVQHLIDRADHEKLRRARARLASTDDKSPAP